MESPTRHRHRHETTNTEGRTKRAEQTRDTRCASTNIYLCFHKNVLVVCSARTTDECLGFHKSLASTNIFLFVFLWINALILVRSVTLTSRYLAIRGGTFFPHDTNDFFDAGHHHTYKIGKHFIAILDIIFIFLFPSLFYRFYPRANAIFIFVIFFL